MNQQDQDPQVIDAANTALDRIYDILQALERVNQNAPFHVISALVGHAALSFPDPEAWFHQCLDEARDQYHATLAPILAEKSQATIQ